MKVPESTWITPNPNKQSPQSASYERVSIWLLVVFYVKNSFLLYSIYISTYVTKTVVVVISHVIEYWVMYPSASYSDVLMLCNSFQFWWSARVVWIFSMLYFPLSAPPPLHHHLYQHSRRNTTSFSPHVSEKWILLLHVFFWLFILWRSDTSPPPPLITTQRRKGRDLANTQPKPFLTDTNWWRNLFTWDRYQRVLGGRERAAESGLLLLPLLLVLPPSIRCLSSSHPTLVTKLSAACSAVDTRTSPGTGCIAGMERKTNSEMTDRIWKGRRSWRCKPSLSALANNARDQFLWTVIHPVSVFFFLPECEYKGKLEQKHCSLNQSVHLLKKLREKGIKRERKENISCSSNLVPCQETQQGSVHQWQTRPACLGPCVSHYQGQRH